VHAGIRCAVIGTCGAETITITVCMDDSAGLGADTVGLACICIDCALCTAITKAIGGEFDHTGISGEGTITIDGRGGFGASTAELVDISTGDAFCAAGMAADGCMSGVTGISTDGIITIITFMDATNGSGAASAGLVCTCIACARCTATTKAIGDVCGLTGTCGVGTITTGDLAGSGVDTAELVVICTVCEFSVAGTARAGTTCAATGTCGDGTITTITCTAVIGGRGADSAELAFIFIGCERCIATTKVIGDEFGPTGICGVGIIITNDHTGSGEGTERLVGTSIVCASCAAGMVLAGTMCAATGIYTVAITTTTTCMVDTSGCGVASGGSVCTCIDTVHCIAITRVTGVACGRIGICGVATITTDDLDGSGVGIAGLDGTSIVCESCAGGLGRTGAMCEHTGICTDATTTITTCMVDTSGCGAAIAASVCTDTVCEHCTATTKDIGGVFELIGICGAETSTTAGLAGSGADTGKLVDTNTAYAFSDVGMVRDGIMCGRTGICIAGITTITISMEDTDGLGDDIDESVYIYTACEPCIAITRGIGVGFALTGICGVEITTTRGLGGSGGTLTGRLGVISTGCESTDGGMVVGGTTCAVIGTCGGRITTTTTCMDATAGLGVVIAVLVSTSTDCEPCTETTRVTGDACALTGTCGDATITTDALAGFGAGTDVLVDIYTACASCGAGMARAGTTCAATGTCGDEITTTITCMAGTSGYGDDSGALVCISIDCAPCTETIRAIGVACVPIGTCGEEIITTAGHAGSGDDTDALDDIYTVCAFCGGGMVPNGTMCGRIGICIDAIITTITSMAVTDGRGADIAALVYTCIACVRCTGIIKAIGVACAHTGICIAATTITSVLAGSGVAGAALADISTGCESFAGGMAAVGSMCAPIGTCGGAITTTTTCTAGTSGSGASIAALVCTCTACEPCTATTKATGAESGRTGTCGDATITTDARAGSGAVTAESTGTSTDCASSDVGMVPDGITCDLTGTSGDGTTIITTCMDGTSGRGGVSGVLECTFTACEPCTATTRDTGVVSVRTGTCGVGITTTADPVGSGDEAVALDGTFTVCAS